MKFDFVEGELQVGILIGRKMHALCGGIEVQRRDNMNPGSST